ncbi:MAG: peptide ABC transporter ATP-binding protein, partial [Thermoprotei archaeon]
MSRLPSDTVLAVYKLRKYFPLRRGLTEIFKGLPPRYVRAVDDITFFIREGETFCLVGESGCGKTTTGRVILRLIEPTSGYIFYRPKEELLKELTSQIPNLFVRKGFIDVAQIPIRFLKPLRKELQVIFQDPYGSLNPRFKIRAILEEPLLVHGLGETHEERTNIVRKALEDVRLIPPEEFMDRYPHMLSGGQRQRIGIARAIILEPRFIVADEPVSMLDVSIRAEILELMMELKKKYSLTYLFITHDL